MILAIYLQLILMHTFSSSYKQSLASFHYFFKPQKLIGKQWLHLDTNKAEAVENRIENLHFSINYPFLKNVLIHFFIWIWLVSLWVVLCNHNSDSSHLFATLSEINSILFIVRTVFHFIPLLFQTRNIDWQATVSSRHQKSRNGGKGIENIHVYIYTQF